MDHTQIDFEKLAAQIGTIFDNHISPAIMPMRLASRPECPDSPTPLLQNWFTMREVPKHFAQLSNCV